MQTTIKLLVLAAALLLFWKSCGITAADVGGIYVMHYPDGSREILLIDPEERTYTRYTHLNGVSKDSTVGTVSVGFRSVTFMRWRNFKNEAPAAAEAVSRKAAADGARIEFDSDPDGGPQWIFESEKGAR